MIFIVRKQIILQVADHNLADNTQLALQFASVNHVFIKALLGNRFINILNNTIFTYPLKDNQRICLFFSFSI